MTNLDKKVDKLNKHFQGLRGKMFLPLLKLMDVMRISADTLSTLKLLGGIVYLFLILYDINLAVIVIIIAHLFDLFDGPLARFQKKASDHGKFIDMLTDQALYSMFVFGLIMINFTDTVQLSWNMIAIPFLYLMVIVRKNEPKDSDWLLHPTARLSYYKALIYVPFLMILFGWIEKSVFGAFIFYLNILISLHIVYSYADIIAKKNKV